MAVLFDARGNEFLGSIDVIGGQTLTDARTASAALGALNAEILMDLNGKGLATFHVVQNNLIATLVFEGTVDGTNYERLSYPAVAMVAATVTQMYRVNCPAFRRIRCRVSAFTSGSCTVHARASDADEFAPQPDLFNNGGNYGLASADIAINVAANMNFTAAADIFHLRNSGAIGAKKRVVVRRVSLTGGIVTTALTAATVSTFLLRMARAWTAVSATGVAMAAPSRLRAGQETTLLGVPFANATAVTGLTTTKTNDAGSLGCGVLAMPLTLASVIGPLVLYDASAPGVSPIILDPQEGILITQANLAAQAAGRISLGLQVLFSETDIS